MNIERDLEASGYTRLNWRDYLWIASPIAFWVSAVAWWIWGAAVAYRLGW